MKYTRVADRKFGSCKSQGRNRVISTVRAGSSMRDIYLGDSYDIVKRFWAHALRDIAPMYAHPRFVPVDLRAQFSALTTIEILDSNRLPETPFGMLLDPHTGIPLPDARCQKVSIALAPVSFIAEQFAILGPAFIVCFDQTHDRHRSKELGIDDQREAKRDALLSLGVYSFYYLSHAPFLFMAKDIGMLKRVRDSLTATGIPEQTPATIRLQPIRTDQPEPSEPNKGSRNHIRRCSD